ncbi:MAG: 3-deoxy-D-manno-octulosonic acid transferase [Gemmataceae bacterium]|nr:3-deoxy-D-manno-octulosonic acid transferase [Gemmataceae bacterium]
MVLVRDFLGFILLILLSPWILYRSWRKGKSLAVLWDRFLGAVPRRPGGGDAPTFWFHGVSVGEIHLLRQLIALARKENPLWNLVISASTDNGLLEARRCFSDLLVFPFPLDFSWAVRRALDKVQPTQIVLAESELWPTFLALARSRGVPVAVINARMSPKSQRRYRWMRWWTRPLLSQVNLFAVQDPATAGFFRDMDVPESRIALTGSIKYEGAVPDPGNPKVVELREIFQIQDNQIIWVAGSTQSPEESWVLDAFNRLAGEIPQLRLILVPRQPDQFDPVARMLGEAGHSFARRSKLSSAQPTEERIILVDTLGELKQVWQLADLAFVGGSLDGKRGGQNMIEPAACGAAVFFGPHVWNFKEVAKDLIATGGAMKIQSEKEMDQAVRLLASHPIRRREMGEKAREFVLSQKGATGKTLRLLEGLVGNPWSKAA